MKKFFLLFVCSFVICLSVFGTIYGTGDGIPYFPYSLPCYSNKNGDKTTCYVTKISKAVGYEDGTYEVQLTAADWVGSSIFPVTFTYILNEGSRISLKYRYSSYYPAETKTFVVKSVSTNYLELEEWKAESKKTD